MVLILISVKYMGFKDKNRLAISARPGRAAHAEREQPLPSRDAHPPCWVPSKSACMQSVQWGRDNVLSYFCSEVSSLTSEGSSSSLRCPQGLSLCCHGPLWPLM